jgi:hypothetical protein
MEAQRLNTGMLSLTEDECLRLLATDDYGRIGLVVDGRPEIFPVNYALDHDRSVIFRTADGTKLASTANHPVVFEVDFVARATRTGWSVVVHGLAHHIQTVIGGPRPLSPWLSDRPYTVRIQTQSVTGRVIGPRPSQLDGE